MRGANTSLLHPRAEGGGNTADPLAQFAQMATCSCRLQDFTKHQFHNIVNQWQSIMQHSGGSIPCWQKASISLCSVQLSSERL